MSALRRRVRHRRRVTIAPGTGHAEAETIGLWVILPAERLVPTLESPNVGSGEGVDDGVT